MFLLYIHQLDMYKTSTKTDTFFFNILVSCGESLCLEPHTVA